MPTTTLEMIEEWLQEEYNSALSVYKYAGHVRLTNGSAAHYVDIHPDGERLILVGERYGDSIKTECDPNRESLTETLAHTI